MNTRERNALQQIREATDALRSAGRVEEALEYSLAVVAAVLRQIAALEQQLAKLRRQQVGKRSERISAEQLALMLQELKEELGAAAFAEIAAAQEDAALEYVLEQAKESRTKDGRPRRRGWQARGVERKVHQVALPESERICGRCGRAKRRMGKTSRGR